ncbi:MAG: BCD family MFS transporter [Chromatiales bacterium]|nr:BCD family MFS transporter [Chromatiales bacterium]
MPGLSWIGIIRLGLVQAAIGGVVVLTTSTMNRVMVVELALPALLPGLLVALHYVVQVMRPRMGYGSDLGGRRSPWIVGGMAALALGAVGAAAGTALMGTNLVAGIAVAVLAFILIGLGVGACGTTLLVLMAKRVAPRRLAAAATVTWLMMIFGFILTSVIVGQLIDPYSPERLVAVTAGVGAAALLLTWFAVRGVEDRLLPIEVEAPAPVAQAEPQLTFREAVRQVWSESHSRLLTTFVFVSMLAYSAQDLILEPFAGTIFGMTPGQSTQLSGVQNGGVLVGMMVVALICTNGRRARVASLRNWTVIGCVSSAVVLLLLAVASFVGPAWPLKPTVFLLGLTNGAYATAAIGSMMGLVKSGRRSREGVRMGMWGAAQALAFALGGVVGTAGVDLARLAFGTPTSAYAFVFAAEAVFFVIATVLAVRISRESAAREQLDLAVEGQRFATAAGN